MDLGRLESKRGSMKVITQNSDPQHPLLARRPEGNGGAGGERLLLVFLFLVSVKSCTVFRGCLSHSEMPIFE